MYNSIDSTLFTPGIHFHILLAHVALLLSLRDILASVPFEMSAGGSFVGRIDILSHVHTTILTGSFLTNLMHLHHGGLSGKLFLCFLWFFGAVTDIDKFTIGKLSLNKSLFIDKFSMSMVQSISNGTIIPFLLILNLKIPQHLTIFKLSFENLRRVEEYLYSISMHSMIF